MAQPGSAISAIQNALSTFAERDDLSSAEGCMGLSANCEFGQRGADVTRIIREATRVQQQSLNRVLIKAKDAEELSSSEYRRSHGPNMQKGYPFASPSYERSLTL